MSTKAILLFDGLAVVCEPVGKSNKYKTEKYPNVPNGGYEITVIAIPSFFQRSHLAKSLQNGLVWNGLCKNSKDLCA